MALLRSFCQLFCRPMHLSPKVRRVDKWLCLSIALLCLGVGTASAQDHVLDLDGSNSLVELPANAFSNLDEEKKAFHLTQPSTQRNLEKGGWQIALAENGRAALQAVSERMPDVILLNLMMPEMDGFAFMQALRQREDGRALPVIVITAKELTEEDRRRLRGQGTQILQKGRFQPEELLRQV